MLFMMMIVVIEPQMTRLRVLQKKIILQTAPSGSVSVIDVVPLESSDSSDSQIIVAEQLTSSPNSQVQNGQQVTAQVAVVQAQGSPNGQPQFITVSGKLCEYSPVAFMTTFSPFLFHLPSFSFCQRLIIINRMNHC